MSRAGSSLVVQSCAQPIRSHNSSLLTQPLTLTPTQKFPSLFVAQLEEGDNLLGELLGRAEALGWKFMNYIHVKSCVNKQAGS